MRSFLAFLAAAALWACDTTLTDSTPPEGDTDTDTHLFYCAGRSSRQARKAGVLRTATETGDRRR
ncbi:MAG: hypothetical protein ABIO70_34210 [Pseudomonadota bacterium]